MYVPDIYKNEDVIQLQQFIDDYSFATLISYSVQLHISPLPLILNRDQGKKGTLIGHMAKTNDQWQSFNGTRLVYCLFHGPHAYISPSWYKNHPQVPTWNYAMVQVQGIARLIDQQQLLIDLDRLLTFFDPDLLQPHNPAYIPPEYKQKFSEHIIGFHIEITDIVGKFKLGQNRSAEDQASFLQRLFASSSSTANQLANFIKNWKG